MTPTAVTTEPAAVPEPVTGPDAADVAPRTSTPAFDPERSWRLHDRVALRPEPFGALAYHYGNRRLTFLRSPDLVALVERLADEPSARAAFVAAGIAPTRWPSFAKALTSLAAGEFIVPADALGATSVAPDPDSEDPR